MAAKKTKLVLLSVGSTVIFLTVWLLGRVPDITDREVHTSGSSHVDTAAFFRDEYHFPGKSWKLYNKPETLGWDVAKLEKVSRYADSVETAALMVIHKGVLILDWGSTDEKYITQSMRKGLLNSLYGVYWDKGIIRLESTLEELNITDIPELDEQERQANLEHLLMSSSGVYHSAIYEEGGWKKNKPARGTHRPGEAWYYNNWDFNVLGTVFEQLSQQKIGDAFRLEIARPIGMEDFVAGDVAYLTQEDWSEQMMGNTSQHPAYMFSTSARDMARFGLLYLNKGSWDGQQIFSPEWLRKSWSTVEIEKGYTLEFGYLWWKFEDGKIYPDKTPRIDGDIFLTSGNRGHILFVIPHLDLVVVHRVYIKGIDLRSQLSRALLGMYANVEKSDIYSMLEMIAAAHPDNR